MCVFRREAHILIAGITLKQIITITKWVKASMHYTLIDDLSSDTCVLEHCVVICRHYSVHRNVRQQADAHIVEFQNGHNLWQFLSMKCTYVSLSDETYSISWKSHAALRSLANVPDRFRPFCTYRPVAAQ